MHSTKPIVLQIALVLGAAFAPFFAAATTYNFIGAWGQSWNEPSAWQPAGIPGADDAVILDRTANESIEVPTDVSVRKLTVLGLGAIYGTGRITVTDSLNASFPVSWQVELVLAAGAVGRMDNASLQSQFSGFYFYKPLRIAGDLVVDAPFFSVLTCDLEGSLTVLRGNLGGSFSVKTSGVLNLDAPNQQIELGNIFNKGTVNWKNGRLRSNQDLVNDGVWNISVASDSLISEGIFIESYFTNNGQIRLTANAQNIALNKALRNNGSITLDGANTLHLFALDHRGSITGAAGSTLWLSGYYFGTGNNFRSNSSVAVTNLKTAYLTGLNIESNVQIGSIKSFLLDGSFETSTVFPAAADFDIRGFIASTVDQNFSGKVVFQGGISGPVRVNITSTEAQFLNASFGETTEVVLANGAVASMVNCFFTNFVNDGTLNWNQTGGLNLALPGLVNNGVWNISADSIFAMNGNGQPTANLRNVGTINFTGRKASLFTGLKNDGTISVAPNSRLELGGGIEQNSVLSGGAGSQLIVFGGGLEASPFAAGATTSGFSVFETQFADVQLRAGTLISGISQFRWISSHIEAEIVLPPASNYFLENTKLRLKTIFEPLTTLQIVDSDLEGSGSLRIKKVLNWRGGTMDVPLRLFEGATANISENDRRPIISAPFTNDGDITLSGGIIEINTGFFNNDGNWNVDSDDDVIIDGFTAFTNNGIFAICGNQPIRISFNVPFINGIFGIFKGSGSYTFNAGFTNNGTVAPGCSPGLLRIEDDFDTAAGVEIEIAGGLPGEFDRLLVAGDLTARGVLEVTMPNGASFSGALKVIQTEGKFEGTFDQVNLPPNCQIQYETDGISIISDGSVSIANLDAAAGIRIFPTLATDVLQVTFAQPLPADGLLQIVGAQGQIIRSQAIGAGSEQQILQVSDLPLGAFWVRMSAVPAWVGRFQKI